MPWGLLLQTLLPIILTPNHPHAPDAHAILSDAHSSSAQAPGTPSPSQALQASAETIDVLTRCLALCLKAQALSGSAPTPTTQALAQALAAVAS